MMMIRGLGPGSRSPVAIAALVGMLLAALALSAAAGAAEATAAKKGKQGMKKYNGPKIKTPNAGRCDFLDTSVCLHPFPNSLYLDKDRSTGSGWRVDINQKSMLANVDGERIDVTDHNRNDGFSPGQAILVHVKGLKNQKAFDKSKIVPIDDVRDYKRKKQPVVVINAKTKERHPIFAELDANPEVAKDRNLIIRPLRNWDEDARYIVALRNLKKQNGKEIKAPNAFRVYRDKLKTGQKKVEMRRDYFEKKIFKQIAKTKRLGRKNLYMAWDFRTASEQGLSERVLAMRDDAFARLGDTDLADGVIQGSAPKFTVTEINEDPNDELLREVKGTLDDLPCYLDTDGCAPGSKFAYKNKKATMPTFNPGYTADVPFECNIPKSVANGVVNPARPALYGHGLLGSREQSGSSYVRDFGNDHNVVHCAVNWDGFSEDDVGPVVLPGLTDVSRLTAMFDRMQQGFVNFLMLGRALAHPDGFAKHAAFMYDAGAGPKSVIEPNQLYFYGNSQGGIMGGALTALAPDFKQSVLGVPGMNYSTLLRRSVDFDAFSEIPDAGLYDNYPKEAERPLLLGLMQMLWDRGEGNGYAHHMTDDPLPDTPRHHVLLHAALGDHQVANITAEVEARTIGAKVLKPALDPGRHWESKPFMQIPAVGSLPSKDSALVYWDGGPPGFFGAEGEGTGVPPNENVPPRPETGFGEDPHSYPRKDSVAQKQMSDWLMPGGAIMTPCPTGTCYANGWTGP